MPKKDRGLWLCVDYWGLNIATIKNYYALPLIGETLDQLAGAKIFTQLDLHDAYHYIRICEDNKWKTAFRTYYRYFEYTIMLFRLTNASATFQAYINKALRAYNLYYKLSKCAFNINIVNFLGFMVSLKGIHMEPVWKLLNSGLNLLI